MAQLGRVQSLASATIDLFEVVTFVAVALLLLVGVVVAALGAAPLLGLLLGGLGPAVLHLAPRVALRTQVRAARGLVAAAAPPALRLSLGLGFSLRLGLRLGLFGLGSSLEEGGEGEHITPCQQLHQGGGEGW